MKKVPKTDKVGSKLQNVTAHDLHVMYIYGQADPKRVKKALPKILKGMKPVDRVMIIGTTKSPFGEWKEIRLEH